MEAWRALPLLCLLRFWFWSAPTCMSCADMPKVEKCGFSMSACTTDEGKTPSYRRQPADAPKYQFLSAVWPSTIIASPVRSGN